MKCNSVQQYDQTANSELQLNAVGLNRTKENADTDFGWPHVGTICELCIWYPNHWNLCWMLHYIQNSSSLWTMWEGNAKGSSNSVSSNDCSGVMSPTPLWHSLCSAHYVQPVAYPLPYNLIATAQIIYACHGNRSHSTYYFVQKSEVRLRRRMSHDDDPERCHLVHNTVADQHETKGDKIVQC